MRSSFRLFKLMGISIEVHVTFLLFFLLIFFAGFSSFIFFLVVFSIVLAHELCHSIAAILSGVPVPRIILLPFGGLASIELPEEPLTELKISLSGPLFNFFFAAVGFTLIKAMGLQLFSYDQLVSMLSDGSLGIFTQDYVLSMIVMLNMLLGLFNMLPAFPMDGGRVFRSVLALWTDYVKATEVAGRIGQFIFMFLIVAGIFTLNIWWIAIGVFLTYASSSEVKFVLLKKTFDGLYMRDLIASQKRIPVAEAGLSFRDFMRVVAKPEHRLYLVVSRDGSLAGVLDLDEVQAAAAKVGGMRVGSLASAGYGVVNANQSVADAMKRILSGRITLVVDENVVLGYMTPELFMELTRFYRVKSMGSQPQAGRI